MFRSLAAGAKVELCLRCEARFLLVSSASRYFSTNQSRRAQVSKETDIDQSSHLLNVSRKASSSNTAHDGKRSEEEEPIASSDVRAVKQLADDSLDFTSHDTNRSKKYPSHRRIPLSNTTTSDLGRSNGHSTGLTNDRPQFKYPAWRHPDVASDRVELGVERLGEPATIRVLPEEPDREKAKRKKTYNKNKDIEQKSKPQQVAPNSFVAWADTTASKDDRVAGDAEAFNNIETLRKTFFNSINIFEGASEKECRELGRSLERGFTTHQLRSYLRFAMTMKLPEADILEFPRTTERYQVSRWYAGPSRWLQNTTKQEHYFTFPGIKDHYAICHTGEKDKLGFPIETSSEKMVNRVLRLCWGIRSREEKLQRGSVALKINEDWIAMLLHQEKIIFHRVARLFKVQTKVGKDGLVVLSGMYDACIDAVRMITKMVDAARTEQITIVDEKPKTSKTSNQVALLRDITASAHEFWEQIGRQTQTRIAPADLEPDGSYRKLNIFYRPRNSNSIPAVLRWISYIQKILRQKRIPYYSISALEETFPSLVPIPTSPNMSLVDRHSHWYRWRSYPPPPTDQETRAAESTKTQHPSLPRSIKTLNRQIGDRFMTFWEATGSQAKKIKKGLMPTSEYWEPQPQTSLLARLGHLVHAIPAGKETVLQETMDKVRKSEGTMSLAVTGPLRQLFSFRRMMTTGLPPWADTLTELVLDKPAVSSFFRIVLMPSSIIKSLSPMVSNVPPLEIDVSIDESTKTVFLRQARFVLDRQYVDLALPEHPVDVRFATDTLMLARRGNVDPAITDFLENCDLNVWGTGQFKTPSSLTLVLPTDILQLSTDWTRVEINALEPSHGESISKIADVVENSSKTVERLVADIKAFTMHTDQSSEAADTKYLSKKDHKVDDAMEEQDRLSDSKIDSSPQNHQSMTKAERHAAQQVQVIYNFDSLAVHSMVQSSYQEYTLAFSTIEAGQIGGKQQILEMETTGIADSLARGEGYRHESVDAMRGKFSAFYDSLSEFIGRLPK